MNNYKVKVESEGSKRVHIVRTHGEIAARTYVSQAYAKNNKVAKIILTERINDTGILVSYKEGEK